MARLAGVDIPNEKRIEIALTYIFGVGRTRAKETLAATGINPDTRVKDLTDEQLITLRDYLEGNYKIEGDLDALLIGDVDSGKTCHCDSFCFPQVLHRVVRFPGPGLRTRGSSRSHEL